MSRLFVALYFDEDVHSLIATLVRGWGFSVQTTVEAGNRGRSDAEQLAHAVGRQLTLLTHNRVDFERLAQEYFATNRDHPGIIIAVQRTPYDVAQRLRVLLDQVSADEMVNQLVYL
jgi:hypothetical protein